MPGDLGRGHRLVEGHPDEALRRQVVDLRRPRRLQQTDAGRQIGQVVFDQMQVRVVKNPEFLDPPEIDGTGAAVGAIHGVALVEQQLRQIGTVLASNTSNDCIS